MFLICDKNDVVVDMASERANLSCGYAFDGYKQHDDVKPIGIMLDDTYRDGILTQNPQTRLDMLQKISDHEKIQSKIRAIAIEALKASGELPADFKDPYGKG